MIKSVEQLEFELNELRSDATNFLIPQDLAPENYLVNQPLTFVLDAGRLATFIPEELLQTTKFSWDFGDGTKKEGIENVPVCVPDFHVPKVNFSLAF